MSPDTPPPHAVGAHLALAWCLRRLQKEAPQVAARADLEAVTARLRLTAPAVLHQVLAHPEAKWLLRGMLTLIRQGAHRRLPDGQVMASAAEFGAFALATAVLEPAPVVLWGRSDMTGRLSLPGTGQEVVLPPMLGGRWLRVRVDDNGEVTARAACGRDGSVRRRPHVKGRLEVDDCALGDVDARRLLALIEEAWARLDEPSRDLVAARVVAVGVQAAPGRVDRRVACGLIPCAPGETSAVLAERLKAIARRSATGVPGMPGEIARDAGHQGGSVTGSREPHPDPERLQPGNATAADLLTALGATSGIPVNRPGTGRMRLDHTLDHLSLLAVRDPAGYTATRRRVENAGRCEVAALLRAHVAYVERNFRDAAGSYAGLLDRRPDGIDLWRDFTFALRHLGFDRAASAWLFHPSAVLDRARQVAEGVALDTAVPPSGRSPLDALDGAAPRHVRILDWVAHDPP